MIFNLYSSLSMPMQKVILPDSVLHERLTTIVMDQFEYDYVHLYEKCKGVYKYVRTIKLSNK